MKLHWIVLAFLLASISFAQIGSKVWVSIQWKDSSNNEVLFIEDKETGTRCYALSNGDAKGYINSSAYAISCIPKGNLK